MPRSTALKSVVTLLALCLFAVGCIPVKNVEKAWKTSKADNDLAGNWVQTGGGDGKVGFVKTDQDYLITSGTSGLEGACRSVQANGHKFIIVAKLRAAILGFDQVDADTKDGTLMRYKIDGDKLTLYTYDSERIAEAVKAKKVPGEIDENDSATLSELDDATLQWLGEIASQEAGWDAQNYKRKN